MNKFKKLLLSAALVACVAPVMNAEHLIILATNDTHSQIDPVTKDNMGGVFRRRAIFDETRARNKNVLVVDAGDDVQGTLFFNVFRGEVEYAMLDTLGYDVGILGNHEFDNGLDELAKYYKKTKVAKISANYDFSGTVMQDVMRPYVIREYDGKRVGIFGINVQPAGLISYKNYKGLRYLSCEDVADATARYLKEVQKVDYTVMLSHIGYESDNPDESNDSIIAAHSRYIDLIIGAHSHTDVIPGSQQSLVRNADGKIVTIGQNYKTGKHVGRYDIDLDKLTVTYDRIPVDASWDAKANYPAMKAWLETYRTEIDSLMTKAPIARSAKYMVNNSIMSSNWISDAVKDMIGGVSGIKNVDAALMNVGGIRQDMPEGVVNEGVIVSMFPFDNKYVVLEMTGEELIEALRSMARRKDYCVSREITAVYNESTGKIEQAKLKGKKVNPKGVYRIATIDYLANGGDYMDVLKGCKRLFEDHEMYGNHVVRYVKQLGQKGIVIEAPDKSRITVKK